MKRKKSCHIVVVQKLMTPMWLKQLYKAADLIFYIPAKVNHPFWPSKHHEALTIALLFPTYHIGRGSSKAPQKCSQWVGSCHRCSRKRVWPDGIFCSNFFDNIGDYRPCHMMWCGLCYTSKKKPKFHVATPEKDNLVSESQDLEE